MTSFYQWRNEGGIMPQAPNHRGAPKSPDNAASTFFNRVHLLPKDFRVEHGGAKLVSYTGGNLASVRLRP